MGDRSGVEPLAIGVEIQGELPRRRVYNSTMGDALYNAIPLSERDIKLAVIAHLERTSALQDGVVINELPVANWSRRADLAVANGKLQAFEIKSDFDSLRRLDGQIALFATRFDKVVLVTTNRFISSALERLPAFVEIWEASRQGQEVRLRVVRRGQTREIKSRHILSSYLQKSEIASFIRSTGNVVPQNASRDEMEKILETLPVSKLRLYVLSRLKQRYRADQEEPLLTRTARAGLRRPAVMTEPRTVAARQSASLTPRGGRFEAFELRFGSLPEEAPLAVRKRRKG